MESKEPVVDEFQILPKDIIEEAAKQL
jgi:polynucleotide 5'-kinase involved in rRNA processing